MTNDWLRELFVAPSWPPNGGRAEGGYVLVFSECGDELGYPPRPAAESTYRETFRVLATPEAFERFGSGQLRDDVPQTVALVELITPDGLRIDSRLVLMTDDDTRAAAIDAIRRAIAADPGPVPVQQLDEAQP